MKYPQGPQQAHCRHPFWLSKCLKCQVQLFLPEHLLEHVRSRDLGPRPTSQDTEVYSCKPPWSKGSVSGSVGTTVARFVDLHGRHLLTRLFIQHQGRFNASLRAKQCAVSAHVGAMKKLVALARMATTTKWTLKDLVTKRTMP